jgi:hypothetical protein
MRLIIISALLLLLAACTTVKRYASIEPTIQEKPFPLYDTGKNLDESALKVVMTLSDYKIEPNDEKPTFKTLWDLQGQGQKALLESLNHRYTKVDKFTGSLNNKYLKSDDKIDPVLDLTKRNVKFVFTIRRWRPYGGLGNGDNGFSLADRIEYLRYSLTLDDPSFYFVNWNKYSTEYGSINIADVSYQQSLSLTASAGDSALLGASATGSASKTENQHLQYRYIQLNGTLKKDKIEFESEGTRETDLSGNVVADVAMKFKCTEHKIFFFQDYSDNDTLKKPKELDLTVVTAKVPSAQANKILTGVLDYTYSYRHVLKRAKTIYEWDDKVQYYTGRVIKKVNILLPEDILPNFYAIMPVNSPIDTDNLRLKIVDSSQARDFLTTDLVFPDPESASDFLDWLTKYPTAKKDQDQKIVFANHMQLFWNGHFLTRGVVDSLVKTGAGFLAVRFFPEQNSHAQGTGVPDRP